MEHILVVGVFHQYLQQAHLSQNGKLRRLQEDAKAREPVIGTRGAFAL